MPRSGSDASLIRLRGGLPPGQIVLAHIMALAEPPGGVGVSASRNSTARPAIGALAFRRKATIAAYLLIMTETQALGDLHPTASIDPTTDAPAPILAFRSQVPMSTNLLVMLGTVS